VQFIYGSKPFKKYRATEKKWFGGMPGGHVGIECDPGRFLSFEGKGKYHLFGRKKNRHSIYKVLNAREFWDIMGTSGDSVKKLTVVIPVSRRQKEILDSLGTGYLRQTPYDYALFGMRCASATYEVLAQMGIVRQFGYRRTCMKIFYPRRIRKRLLSQARTKGWHFQQQKGTARRKWERDV
jgi:hypothetical protein